MSDPNWLLIDQHLKFISEDLARLHRRLDDTLGTLVKQHGERIARLEQRLMADKKKQS